MLIAPLDWGLGHATRCIVIIRFLQSLDCEITIAVSDKLRALLYKEFPDLQFLPLPGYNISYSRTKRWLPVKILLQMPKILKIIRFENKWLKNVQKTNKFDIILSDNRFGLYSKDAFSIFITHQLLIKTNYFWLDKIVQNVNYRYISFFSACWIPDFGSEKNIAGALAHPKKLPVVPVKYIGALSRFSNKKVRIIDTKWMVIISGPEPQRSIFEKKVFDYVSASSENFIIVRGLPGETENHFDLPNCKIFNHLNTEDMQVAIESCEYVISRCGYTTVMEILSMKKKSVFIPTPGQTEQEYLAGHLLKQQWCYTFEQSQDFSKHFEMAQSFKYSLPQLNMELYKEVISDFMQSIY